MKVQVNNKQIELPVGANLLALAEQMQLTPVGIAIAVNNQLIVRAQWAEFILQENDQVVIIKAACGG